MATNSLSPLSYFVASKNLPKSYSEAIKTNSPSYFTGKPCKYGHLSARSTRRRECIVCRRAWNSENKKRNPDANRRSARKWKRNNKDRVKIKNAEWRQRNPEAVKAMSFRFRERTREAAKERTQKWREKNPLRAKQSKEVSRLKHPESYTNAHRRRRARKRNAAGKFTSFDLSIILKLQKWRCAYCRQKFGKLRTKTLDHILALKNGGSNDPRNLQFLCMPCNSSKGAKDAIEFARKHGRLL